MTGGIYQILNTTNGHKYIGSAINFKGREAAHWSGLNKGNHNGPYLQNAYNKCGREAFEFSPLIHLEPWELIRHEQFFIDTIKPEYNAAPIAGSLLGYKHSEESKAKMSLAQRGNKHALGYRHSKEAKAKISAASKRRGFSKEHRANISKALKGRKFSKEHIANISKANKGREVLGVWVGRKFTKEHREKISTARMGHEVSEATKAKISKAHKGKKLSEEHKAKLSEAKRDKPWSLKRRMAHNGTRTFT